MQTGRDSSPATYTQRHWGNEALGLGHRHRGRAWRITPIFYSGYPITPASRRFCTFCPSYKHYGVTTFQAEDEIAAVSRGHRGLRWPAIGSRRTSGPGDRSLKSVRRLGLAIMPRAAARRGRRTARRSRPRDSPTKTEQADLFSVAVWGRNGDMPDCRSSPQALRRLLLHGHRSRSHRRQVHDAGDAALTDGYVANSSEPWKIPTSIRASRRATSMQFAYDPEGFQAYKRARGHARARLGGARHPGDGAPHRRAEKDRQHRATSPTTRINHEQDDPACAPPRSRNRGRIAARLELATVDQGDSEATCSLSAGAGPTGRSGGQAVACSRRRTQRVSHRAPAPPLATCPTALEQILLSRFNSGPGAELNNGQLVNAAPLASSSSIAKRVSPRVRGSHSRFGEPHRSRRRDSAGAAEGGGLMPGNLSS